MKRIIFLAIMTAFLIGCAANKPVPTKTFVIKIDGDVAQVVDDTEEHPCKGNWNFCDQAIREWMEASDRDTQAELDTFMIPAF